MERPYAERPLFQRGQPITAEALNQLAAEVYASIEVGPGLTKGMQGGRVVIGLKDADGAVQSGWIQAV